ncbi:hypothetical protein Ahy_Scaffold8g108396 [Arachis hypogaea]|uniref:CCHC-type domain-containing protein n=1 Tax=Arachis hypogaea TaxID=3818 RepID=A0A444WNE2_ARAHY|nr:hypothetical protein Ahy_Scaffold8g108396 [Arachis hypogaea]
MGLITIVCHHGGSFVRSEDGVLSYTRDHISEIPKLDPDRLDVFFIRNYYKELGYDKAEHCWWLVPNRPLETGLRKLNSDAELLEMCFLAESNHGEVHVYYEHGVSIPTYLEEPPFKKGKEVVVEVPTQPVLLRIGPSSTAIPPHPVPNPCINHLKTTEPTQEATSTKTTPAPPNQDMDHSEVPVTTTKSTPIFKSTIPTPISMAATPTPPNQDMDHTQAPTTTTKSIPIPKSTPTPVPKPKQGKIFQPKVSQKKGTEKKGAALKKTVKKGEPRTTLNRRYITRGLAKGHVARETTKGKGKQADTVVLSESDSSDIYESAEDSAYKPGAEESSSEKEVTNTILKAKRKEVSRKHRKKVKVSKLWKEILEPDDGLVPEDDSGEDDELFFGQPANHNPNIGGAPKKKRRKEADEGPVGGKKQKITKMKRVYKEGSCRHCGGKGHDKRNCAKKKADDEAAAVAAAVAATASEANTGNQQQPPPAAPEVQDEGNVTEIEVLQPQARPPKLPQKRRQPPLAAPTSIPPAATSAPPPSFSNAPPAATVPISNTPPPTTAHIDLLVGASAATASRLRNAMRFVPTPGFKPPKKFKK